MRKSRDDLRGKWGIAIVTFVIYFLLTGFAASLRSSLFILSLIVAGPFALGAATFSLAVARGKETRIELIFQGFNQFTNALAAYLLMILYIVLWALLLIVPGIVAALSYSMTFYILHDDASIKPEDALRKSKVMMEGYKVKLFYLCLRLFLLVLLCILTFGIGFFWFVPFAHVTMANFYDDIRNQ